MLELTFAEQVKIVLSRKGMSIKELAELIERRTGKKMSRQNLTQRLSRDNFQEQDMRMIAGILECPFRLSILDDSIPAVQIPHKATEEKITEPAGKRVFSAMQTNERDITVGEILDIHEKLDAIEEAAAQRAAEEKMEAGIAMEEGEVITDGVAEDFADDVTEDFTDDAVGNYIDDTMENFADSTTENFEDNATEYFTDNAEEDIEQPVITEESVIEPEVLEAEEPEYIETLEHTEEPKNPEQEPEKHRGFRAYFQRRRHRNEEEQTGTVQEEVAAEPEPEAEPDGTGEDEMEMFETEAAYEDDIYITSESSDMDDLISGEGSQEEFQREFMDYDEDTEIGEVNPYTGREYQTNSVRMHPDRIGYVQVYDRADHKWTDMTEWAFLGYQERKKALLGNDYEPPIYLD